MPRSPQLSDKLVKQLNQQLENLQWLHGEICKAEDAGIAGIEGRKQYCSDLIQAIEKVKLQYAPRAK